MILPVLAGAVKVAAILMGSAAGAGLAGGAVLHRKYPKAADAALDGMKSAVAAACHGAGWICAGIENAMRKEDRC
jgi:hypothetical protein